ncbi:MAG: hypothetical protein PHE55_03895 [Methylococcaceae bacterium]|nr:hypothetical protein [Methylococcaceae bacterium]
MHTAIASLIHSYNGYMYESAGVINAFFTDPEHAHDCAKQITDTVGLAVEVCGDQLIIELP